MMGEKQEMTHSTSQMAESPHQALAAYLKKNNMNMTPQRRMILDVFMTCADHVTSEELYERIRAVDAGVGLATVFRTLKLLVECGVARVVRFKDGLIRYEYAWGREHHDHMVCDECGRKIEVKAPELSQLLGDLAEQVGFKLTGHLTYLSGVCSECRKKKKGNG